MKRRLIVLIMMVGLLFPSLGFSAGSVVQTMTRYENHSSVRIRKVTFVCIGDAGTGSIPDTDTSSPITIALRGWRLYQVEAFPTSGGTAPDAADVFVLDSDGLDLLGSVNGSTTAYRGLTLIHATLKVATLPDIYHLGQTAHETYFPMVTGALTLKVKNQATASADYTVVLTFRSE